MTQQTSLTAVRQPADADAIGRQATGYWAYWAMEPIDRITWVKSGAPENLLHQLANDLRVNKVQLCKWLDISPKQPARHARTAQIASERLLGLVRLVGEVEQIMLESSDHASFDAPLWIGQWLNQSQLCLSGAKPCDYLDCGDGYALLSTLLRQQQSCVCL